MPFGRITVNHAELAGNSNAIPKEPHFRARLVSPVHGYFCDPIAALLGDEQQFKVKTVSIDSRDGEKISSHGSFE